MQGPCLTLNLNLALNHLPAPNPNLSLLFVRFS